MSQEEKSQEKTTAENFGELIKAFGNAVGEIFDDPKLKEKAKEFADSATESAKVFGSRFKDEEVLGNSRLVLEKIEEYIKEFNKINHPL